MGILDQFLPSPQRYPQISIPGVDKNILGNVVTTAINNPRHLPDLIKGTIRTAGARAVDDLVSSVFNESQQFMDTSSKVSPNSDLAKALNRPDPLMQHNWNAFIVYSNQFLPPQYLERVVFPDWKAETASVMRGRIESHYVKRLTASGEASVECYEDARLTVKKYFDGWRRRIQTSSGILSVPSQYRGRIVVYPEDVTHSPQGVFVLNGVVPTSFPDYNFTSGSSERHTPLVTFTYENVSHVFGGAGSPSPSSTKGPLASLSAVLEGEFGVDPGTILSTAANSLPFDF